VQWATAGTTTIITTTITITHLLDDTDVQKKKSRRVK